MFIAAIEGPNAGWNKMSDKLQFVAEASKAEASTS
jgi:hypothetical protein